MLISATRFLARMEVLVLIQFKVINANAQLDLKVLSVKQVSTLINT